MDVERPEIVFVWDGNGVALKAEEGVPPRYVTMALDENRGFLDRLSTVTKRPINTRIPRRQAVHQEFREVMGINHNWVMRLARFPFEIADRTHPYDVIDLHNPQLDRGVRRFTQPIAKYFQLDLNPPKARTDYVKGYQADPIEIAAMEQIKQDSRFKSEIVFGSGISYSERFDFVEVLQQALPHIDTLFLTPDKEIIVENLPWLKALEKYNSEWSGLHTKVALCAVLERNGFSVVLREDDRRVIRDVNLLTNTLIYVPQSQDEVEAQPNLAKPDPPAIIELSPRTDVTYDSNPLAMIDDVYDRVMFTRGGLWIPS